MLKKLLFLFFITFSVVDELQAQAITVSNIVRQVPTNNRFSTCGNGNPVVLATFVPAESPGSHVSGGAVICDNPCDTTTIDIVLQGLQWNQSPNANWIHGIYVPAAAGVLVRPSPPPVPTFDANYLFMSTGCTGACPGPPTNIPPLGPGGAVAGGTGYYFVGPGQSCCPGGASTPIPCDNYGDGAKDCGTIFNYPFRIRVCNTIITGTRLTIKVRADSDGNTGCWTTADSHSNTIVFDLLLGPGCGTLYNPIPSATAVTKDCSTPPNYTTTITGGCGNSNVPTWWTASTGGTQIGSGNNFVYTSTTCMAGTTVYEQCCPSNTVCQTRKAFAIPTGCPTLLAITNVAFTNGDCTTPSQITGVTTTGGSGTITFTLNPGGASSTTGVFTGLTGTSYTVTATDALGCSSAPYTVTFTPTSAATFTAATSTVAASCPGVDNGSATVNITPVATYTYVLDSDASTTVTNSTGTVTFTGLAGGPHSIAVTNTSTPPCTLPVNVTVGAGTAISGTSSTVTPSCNNSTNGSMAATPSSGTAPYTYTINAVPANISGLNSGIFTNLAAGTYTITFTDNNGCRGTVTGTVAAGPALTATATPSPASCPGVDNGTVTITAPTGTAPFTYTLNEIPGNITGASSGIFTGLPGGSYTITLIDQSGCTGTTAAVTVTTNTPPPPPAAASPITYCQDATAVPLTATGTGLLWYNTVTGGTGSSTAITPATNVAGTFTFYVSQTTAGPCESARTPITVNITATPAAPGVTTPINYCQNNAPAPLAATGTGLLWYTAATGGTGSSTPPTVVTSATGTFNFYVSQTVSTCESPRAQIVVNVTAPPAAPAVTSPVIYCRGETAVPLSATGTGLLWYTAATGGTGSATAPAPSTATATTLTYYVSQTAGSCESPRASITVTINPTPAAPGVTTPVVYCQGATASVLSATIAGGNTSSWYTVATGGTPLPGAPTPSTATVGSTTYYVSQTTGICEGPRAAIVVTINITPAAPGVTTPIAYCQNDAATPLTAIANAGSTLNWYTIATGGTSVPAPTPSTTTIGSTTYYVSQTTGICEGPRTALVVNVTAPPAAPVVTSPVVYCQNETATALTATPNAGATLNWYTTATGGTALPGAPVPVTTTAGNTIYYVSQTAGSCESARTAITVTINATPALPTVTSPVAYCQNATAATLTATGTGLLWYTAATGGTPLPGAPTPVTTTGGSTVYYVSQTINSCEGSRASITVNVEPTPAAPTVTSPVTYCPNATATPLTATATGTLNWYTVATGGTSIPTAPTPNTSAVGSTTYYVSQTINSCEGPRTAIVVDIIAPPPAPGVISPIAYCQGVPGVQLTATGTGLLWYTTATGGTGDPVAPTPITATVGTTTYYVSQTSAANCEGPRAAIVVNVNTTLPAPTVTTPVIICQNVTASALTATGSGLLWYTTATGGTGNATAPVPVTTTPGSTSYFVSQTSGTCEGPRAEIIVDIIATPVAPTVTTPVAYCENATATALTAAGNNLLWYTTATGGTGNATAPVPVTTTAGSTTYYVSQSTTTGSCEGPRASITVNVIAAPVAPAVTTPVTYCQNAAGAVPLTATGTGLLWYTTATGGTGSVTAPTPSTGTAGTTNYYVSQTTGTCEGPRAVIAVNINATPTASFITVSTSCPAVNNGEITMNTPTTGTAPFSYTVNTAPPVTNGTGHFTGLAGGPYTIAITDANSCTGIINVSVPTGAAITASATATATSCNNATDGTITVSPANAGSYIINTTPTVTNTTGIFTGLAAGNYIVTYTDANGCTASTTQQTVDGGPELTASFVSTPTSCPTVSNGSITISAPSGTAPFSYSLNTTPVTVNTTGSFSGLASGPYTITFTDANGCTGTLDITVASDPAISASAAGSVTSCNNATDGAVTVTPANAGSYTINTIPTVTNTTGSFAGLAVGSYTVTYTDVNGCTATAAASVIAGPALAVITAAVGTSCPGNDDGEINVIPPTAGGSYTYTIDAVPPNTTGATTGVFINLPAGNYVVTVTDNTNTCDGTADVTVAQGAALTSTKSSVNPNCAGINDGVFTVTPTNGAAPYSFIIDAVPANTTGASSGSFTGLAPGDYTITFTDANGCEGTQSATITTNPAITASAIPADAKCFSSTDGTITVTAEGGVAPFTYALLPSTTYQSTNVLTGLGAGTYTVRVKDNVGCTFDITGINLGEPAQLSASAVKDNNTTCEGNDGGITVSATGGTIPYEYSIDNGTAYQASGVFTNAINTAYNGTIKVKDANGCIAVANDVTIGQDNNLTLDILVAADTTICQEKSVKFSPVVTNAGASAAYTWTSLTPAVPNSTIDSIHSLNATVSPADTAVYELKVNYKACSVTDNVKVNVIWKPKVDAGLSTAICRNDSTLLIGFVSHISGIADSLAWTPLDSVTTPSNSLTTWVHPQHTTYYYLTAYTREATYGCDFAVYDSVKVVIPADVIASAGRDTIAVKNAPHQLLGSGGVVYKWWSPSVSIASPFSQNPFVTLTNDANFFVEVKNSIGCPDTAHVFVKVLDGPEYYIPNAFSPNGDGMNDIFRAIPAGMANTEYFKVFNRYGQTVFETNQYLKGWDGTFKGKKQPAGVYIWQVRGADKNGKLIEKQGTVMLIQ